MHIWEYEDMETCKLLSNWLNSVLNAEKVWYTFNPTNQPTNQP